jgi:protocatechuate 3,4-dioxygenase beta subunit
VWDVPREEVAVTLVLGAPGCSLLGTVVDPSGRPVPEARVFVACDDAITASKEQRLELFMTTDLTGRFVCDEVPAGERSIVADAPGFAAAMARITTTPTETATTTLALRVGATLSGRVTDDGGRPLAGVNVAAGLRTIMLGFSSSWRWERSAATDADGRYRLDAIAPGSVQARVAVEPEVLRSFELVEGEQVTWDVTKEPERCIAGIVLGPEDRPMKGWQIRLRGHTARGDFRSHEAMADTDAAGRFRLAGLADIDYRVFVFAPLAGKGGSRAAAMVPRAVLAAVRPSPTELTVRLDAAALASGWIEGSIAMPEGLAAKAELSLYAQILRGGAFSLPTERLEAGVTTFRIGPLPAGDYDLLCDIEGRTRLAQKGLHLAPGATLRLPPFAADAQHPLQLVLRHADGRPATGGDVKLRDGLARCRETAPGHYESLPVAPGRYEAVVRGPDFALCTFPLEFTAQAQPFERTVPAGTRVQVCVKPVTPRERWIGGMQVLLTDARGTQVLNETIQVDGKQEFCWPIGLAPGAYSVKVNAWDEGSATTTFQVAAAPLRVELQLAK